MHLQCIQHTHTHMLEWYDQLPSYPLVAVLAFSLTPLFPSIYAFLWLCKKVHTMCFLFPSCFREFPYPNQHPCFVSGPLAQTDKSLMKHQLLTPVADCRSCAPFAVGSKGQPCGSCTAILSTYQPPVQS
ncbi:uncharacterized protein BO95DRAFT_269786 [Aspergillus brunneoviolaceus CBS 621.78]|uniref:Uncharacterized protein n=1 Tax=Aspergillus brunneoviolaceus CBS 621.78 TaxID=1450534 RepID=A0ACD1GK65_9EURO|nr:hypothetical protein BO95DRAFT_269786 [Aspergillus brunneoviolaceus CBS 621.78]RAH49656.1 hypothetical protein BO95DRAFT_269786 [Aspergillus brunneoviolaceus CBS 621.78]